MKQTLLRLFAGFLVLMPAAASAQSADTGIPQDVAIYIMAGFVLVIAILVLIVSIVVLQVLRSMVQKEEAVRAMAEGRELEVEKEESFWKRFLTKANDAVPVEEEEEIMLDHNYDGIRELDNHLPPWWKWLFYGTIAFGVVYLIVYHVTDSLPLQAEEYANQIAEAEAMQAERMANTPTVAIDESTVTYVEDAAKLASGKQVYDNNCAQCHRADGGGSIGPNLTDEYWLHGGSIQDIFRTIKVGVPAKGMISWEPLLSPEQMQNVSSYIMTMQGTNPENPKAPQGEPYQPGSEQEVQPMEADSVSAATASL